MTQMPIFISDTAQNNSHRLVVKKKETPKQKYKKLPDLKQQQIINDPSQANIISTNQKIPAGSKTVVKASSTKLEGLNGSNG